LVQAAQSMEMVVILPLFACHKTYQLLQLVAVEFLIPVDRAAAVYAPVHIFMKTLAAVHYRVKVGVAARVVQTAVRMDLVLAVVVAVRARAAVMQIQVPQVMAATAWLQALPEHQQIMPVAAAVVALVHRLPVPVAQAAAVQEVAQTVVMEHPEVQTPAAVAVVVD
jgi:hypothetical protein